MDAKANKTLIYLYCATKTKPPLSNFDAMGVKIYPIYSQGIYAIASSVSANEFSKDNLEKNLANMKWLEEKALLHEKVIEELMKDTIAIPFKFPTIFQSEENVEKLLKTHNAEFKNMMTELEGKEEWGCKIYCDTDNFDRHVREGDELIKKIDEEVISSNKGKAYFLKKKKEELIEDVMNKKISEYTKDSFDRLSKASVKTKINKLLPKEVTQKKENMVFNGAFLINKKRLGEFNNVLDYLKTKYADKGLIFECTGPWPPYNFCSAAKENING